MERLMPDEPKEPKGWYLSATGGSYMIMGSEATLSVHAPLPESHPISSLVGHVASTWAHLEHTLDLAIWELLGVPPQVGASVTAQIMGAASRCKTIVALCKSKGLDESIAEKATKLMQKTYNTSDKRNRIVHDPFYLNKGSGDPGQFKAMPHKDWSYGIQPVTEAGIRETLEEIAQLNLRAGELRKLVLEAVRTSSEKPK
jgi:hypothetical protein